MAAWTAVLYPQTKQQPQNLSKFRRLVHQWNYEVSNKQSEFVKMRLKKKKKKTGSNNNTNSKNNIINNGNQAKSMEINEDNNHACKVYNLMREVFAVTDIKEERTNV